MLVLFERDQLEIFIFFLICFVVVPEALSRTPGFLFEL